MPMKYRSIKRIFRQTFMGTILLLTIATISYGLYSIRSYVNQVMYNNYAVLEKYTSLASENLTTLANFNQNLVYSNPTFQLLSLDNYADSKRVVAQYNLQQMMSSHTLPWSITMIYDHTLNEAYYVTGSAISQDQEYFLSRSSFLHDLGQEPKNYGMEHYNQWFLTSDGQEYYLVLANNLNRSTMFSLFHIGSYMEYNPLFSYLDNSTIVVFSPDSVVVGEDFISKHEIDLSTLSAPSSSIRAFLGNGFLWRTSFLDKGQIGISIVTPAMALLLHVLPQIGFFSLALVGIIIIAMIMYRFLSRIVIFPLQEIAAMSLQLDNNEKGDSPLPIEKYQEFHDIKTALLDLKEQITQLEIEKRQKELEEEHALLQYFQLQTRSHFFLNCLKSLYNMLENRKYPSMKVMILGFSNHLRYIFHDNSSVVTLESELAEVNDYYHLILLDFSRTLFLNQDVPSELLDCKVPPLIIQTFLENTCKYNAKTGDPLTFHINISQCEDEGKEYLQIHLSDNGIGYDPKTLETINAAPTGTFDQYNVGINNLRRRISLVYNGDFHTAFYNLPHGGACSVLFVPILR